MDESPPAFTFMTEEESKKITGDEAKSVMISYSPVPFQIQVLNMSRSW